MGHREDRRRGCGYEEGAREEMESSCLDGYLEVGSWNSGCCTVYNMALEVIRVECGAWHLADYADYADFSRTMFTME